MVGSTGSGKTTFARALAQRLGVPHVELDALHWQSGWVMTSAEEVRARVAAALSDDGWVVDGNYGGTLGTTVVDQADEIVWLDPPFVTTFSRLLRRTIRRVRTREPLWNTTNYETLRRSFFSRDSILLYMVRSYCRRRRGCRALVANRPHVRLRSASDMGRYLEAAR